jgi:hypothetical protein
MRTPKDFDGKFTFKKTVKKFDFLPGDDSKESFDVWFYRRETEVRTLKEFLESIEPENMGYDKPSNQLFYRAPSGKMYRMDFIEVK